MWRQQQSYCSVTESWHPLHLDPRLSSSHIHTLPPPNPRCLQASFPLLHPLFHSGVLTSALPFFSTPPSTLCVASPPCSSPPLYHTPISRSVSSYLWFLYVHSTFHSVLQSKVQPHCTPFEANVRLKNPPAPPVSQHSWLCPRGGCQRLILAYAVHLLSFVKTFCRRESSHFRRLFWAWSWFFTHFWAGLLNRNWATF